MQNITEVLSTNRAENPKLISSGANIARIINQGNSATIAQAQATVEGNATVAEKQKAALAAKQFADSIAFAGVQRQRETLNNEMAALNVRTAQTVQAESVMQEQRNQKASQLAADTTEVNNSSFFANPIQWFTSRAKLADTKGDLENISTALVDIHNSIDAEYAIAARNFTNAENSKTVLATKQAEQDARVKAETATADAALAAQKTQAEQRALQVIATQTKLDPLALRQQELALNLKFAADSDIVGGALAYGAAYNLNVEKNPKAALYAAAAIKGMAPKERQRWNSIQENVRNSGKPLNASTVFQEFRNVGDTNGALNVLQAADSDLYKVVQDNILKNALGNKESIQKLTAEITKQNQTATGKAKLSATQIDAKVKSTLIQQTMAKPIDEILQIGMGSVNEKLGMYTKNFPQERLNGELFGSMAREIKGLDAHVVEALNSPNVKLAFDTGYAKDGQITALHPTASKMLSGLDTMIAMGIPEDKAIEAYSTILKKTLQSNLQLDPGGMNILTRLNTFGIAPKLGYEIPSIKVNTGLFDSGTLGQDFDLQNSDITNPTQLKNLIERARAAVVKSSVITNIRKNAQPLDYGL